MNRRKHPRHSVSESKHSLKAFIEYMGSKVPIRPLDVSLGGIGLVLEGLPFSIIDGANIRVEIVTPRKSYEFRARVVYSYKGDCAFQTRRYGIEFQIPPGGDVAEFIEGVIWKEENTHGTS